MGERQNKEVKEYSWGFCGIKYKLGKRTSLYLNDNFFFKILERVICNFGQRFSSQTTNSLSYHAIFHLHNSLDRKWLPPSARFSPSTAIGALDQAFLI